jgi:WD40 repeat protein
MNNIGLDDNLIIKRRINIIHCIITFLPNVISRLISDYDYYLEGKSHTFKYPFNSLYCITVLPDGRMLSDCYYNNDDDDKHKIIIWNPFGPLASPRQSKTKNDIILINSDFTLCFDFFPNDSLNSSFRIISGSYDGTIKIWNLETKKCDIIFRAYPYNQDGHTNLISCVAALPDKRIASGSYDGTIKIWNASTGNCDITFVTNPSVAVYKIAVILPKKNSTDVLVNFSYRIVSATTDDILRIWNPFRSLSPHRSHRQSQLCDMTLLERYELYGQLIYRSHLSLINCLDMLPDGRLVSGSGDKTVKIWNLETGKCDITLQHTECVKSIGVLPDGRIVSGLSNKTLQIWNVLGQLRQVQTGKQNNTNEKCDIILDYHEKQNHSNDWIKYIYIFPDGRIVSISGDQIVKIWS